MIESLCVFSMGPNAKGAWQIIERGTGVKLPIFLHNRGVFLMMAQSRPHVALQRGWAPESYFNMCLVLRIINNI